MTQTRVRCCQRRRRACRRNQAAHRQHRPSAPRCRGDAENIFKRSSLTGRRALLHLGLLWATTEDVARNVSQAAPPAPLRGRCWPTVSPCPPALAAGPPRIVSQYIAKSAATGLRLALLRTSTEDVAENVTQPTTDAPTAAHFLGHLTHDMEAMIGSSCFSTAAPTPDVADSCCATSRLVSFEPKIWPRISLPVVLAAPSGFELSACDAPASTVFRMSCRASGLWASGARLQPRRASALRRRRASALHSAKLSADGGNIHV